VRSSADKRAGRLTAELAEEHRGLILQLLVLAFEPRLAAHGIGHMPDHLALHRTTGTWHHPRQPVVQLA
jgi:hypothetical protein